MMYRCMFMILNNRKINGLQFKKEEKIKPFEEYHETQIKKI